MTYWSLCGLLAPILPAGGCAGVSESPAAARTEAERLAQIERERDEAARPRAQGRRRGQH